MVVHIMIRTIHQKKKGNKEINKHSWSQSYTIRAAFKVLQIQNNAVGRQMVSYGIKNIQNVQLAIFLTFTMYVLLKLLILGLLWSVQMIHIWQQLSHINIIWEYIISHFFLLAQATQQLRQIQSSHTEEYRCLYGTKHLNSLSGSQFD